MTNIECPKCVSKNKMSGFRTKRSGRYRRKSDCRWIQLHYCFDCRKSFIRPNPRHGQLKRHKNEMIYKLLNSGVSQRRIAMLLNINRKTVARKLVFLALQAKEKTKEDNLKHDPAKIVVFDDLETFEHTKLKPLSVTLAVTEDRRILGFEVAQMPAKGLLAKKSVKKYGPRSDKRSLARNKLFAGLKKMVAENALFRSDQNPYYPKDLKRHFPNCTHETHKSRRSSVTGQGELKKVGFDPLFALNHTCAMLRANINRLIRKTWCTTKSPRILEYHIAIYVEFHNLRLLA